MVNMINRPDHSSKWLPNGYSNSSSSRHHQYHHQHHHHHDTSMSREFAKKQAREARETLANIASFSKEQDHQRCQFEIHRGSSASTKFIKSRMDKILGTYDNFKKVGGDKTSLLGVDQQPQTPVPTREPIHDPDTYPPPVPHQPIILPVSGSSSKSSQRSQPSPHSSRNGITRPPKSVPPSPKPPHPPSHQSQHSQPRNGEVKGNLKSGPSSGPGDGGGGKITPMGKPHNPPPFKLGGGGGGGGGMDSEDPLLQKILSEMSVKNPVSAIIQTPRPDHHDATNFPFAFPAMKDPSSKDASIRSSRRGEDHPLKFNKPSDIAAQKKNIDGGGVGGELPLSEESDDDQVGIHDIGQVQSSVVGSLNLKPLLSPASVKTSEDSSSDDDSSDSEGTSNNSSEDERPASHPSSPKGEDWKLEKFIPRKIKSPSQEKVAPSPILGRPENNVPVVDKVPIQSQRKHNRRSSKVASNASTHRGSHHNHGPVLHSDDSSYEGEIHSRPTPRTFPQLRTQKIRKTVRLPDSDSDSDTSRSSKSEINPFTVADKSRKSCDLAAVSRESTRRTPKKADSKKDQTSAKHDSGKLKRVKSQEYIPDSDSDSSIIDIESIAPPLKEVPSQRNTPSGTPKEYNSISSPVKAHQPSPHVSPMPILGLSNKNSSRRTPLSESQSLEPIVNSKSDDLFGRSQGNSEKSETVRDKRSSLIIAACTLDKDKKRRDRDPTERVSSRKSKTHRENKKDSGSNSSVSNKDRSKTVKSKGVSESSPLDNRLPCARPGASPLVDKSSESPIVSPEPKVPIPQLHHEYGSRKLMCTIPLSLIDKVPKHSVNCVSYKDEVEKKEVLDNRTTGKGGKGKRKTGDPNTKEYNEDKKTKIISSIFRGVRRPDSENDNDKVKKEPKLEQVDDDDSDNEMNGIKSSDGFKKKEESRPSSVRQHNITSSPLPASSTLDASISSRQSRKKKKDSLPERSPSSQDRKKPRCNSERLAPDYSAISSVGETNSLDSSDVHCRLRTTGVESDYGSSRKRDRERESSMESTRSSSHSESGGRRSKKSRISKSKDINDSSMKSPSVRPGSQRVIDSNSSHAWSQEKDAAQSTYPQRPQLSQQSSQVKVDESQTTPATDSYHHSSRPSSEHESRVDGASFRSNADQTGNSDGLGETATPGTQLENGTTMIPPSQTQKQTSASQPFIDPSTLQAYYANPQKRPYHSYFDRKMIPEINTDYMSYMNMAKHLKHTADAEKDRSMQAMKYLEAALYFILSGKAMENDSGTDRSASLKIYKDTLSFIKYVASVFIREKQEGSLNNKLAVISLRCQSLLSLKIYKMRRHEHKETQRQLNTYFNNYKNGNVETIGNTGNGGNWGGQRTAGSPSHLSQTPSPAGSVGSEGSQSSGYTTSTEGTRSKNSNSGIGHVGHTPPHPQPPPVSGTVPVPLNIHELFVKQNQLSGHLATALDMWTEADNYVLEYGMQDFFIELDRLVSPLTLHSSLSELVYYVQCGLERLKD